MSKRKRSSTNPHHNPRQRKDYIDYDYTSKLNLEEIEFLEKFTNEFYGGAFQINDTYIKEGGNFIQVSGNKDKSKNKDLRKLRGITKYYQDLNGGFTSDSSYKYSGDILHKNIEDRKDLYNDNNKRNKDMSSAYYPVSNVNNTLHTEILNKSEIISREDYKLVDEAIVEAMDILGIEFAGNVQDYIATFGITKKDKEFLQLFKQTVRDVLGL